MPLMPSAAPRFYDAHNHLQDDRFHGAQAALVGTAKKSGVAKMVVNGSCESDWPDVQRLAREHPDLVIPSFGYHPWYLNERTNDWRATLVRFLDSMPSAGGEIGLDRWMENPDIPLQEEMFLWQWRLAVERDLPVSVHCLKAWGHLYDLIRAEPRPACGFLLHSYGGPVEMVQPLAKLGAYFSFPGYYLLERKLKQRETFKSIPPDRLLIETDAPDQLPPGSHIPYPLTDTTTGKPLNHPANLGSIYQGLADFLGEPVEALLVRVEENFRRLFVKVL
ncbi:MAG TPA: TatD family hydrolase [Roseimicrobium sp.]|nr:TatD family hydrolase [Roseimicrobium sp.]